MTEAIVKALDLVEPQSPDGLTRKEVMAQAIAQAVATGTVTLPGGLLMELSVSDWLNLARWVITQVDGPAVREIDMTSGGQPIEGAKGYIGWSPDEWDDPAPEAEPRAASEV